MRAVLRWLAIGAGLVLVVTAGVGWATYRKVSGNIHTDRTAEHLLAQYAKQRPRALVPRARNILVMDSGPGTRPAPGASGSASAVSSSSPATAPHTSATPSAVSLTSGDAAVLLHLSADRQRAAAVAVPGDLMISAPSCLRPDGGASPAGYERFGQAFRNGGAACSIRAFEQFTGIRVDHHLVVDMGGFEQIESAVGGHGSGHAGNGPGENRTSGQRGGDILSALSREARSGGPLAHPARFFGLLDTATSSITADPGLSSLPALYELAGSVRRLPADHLVFRTLPARPADAAPLLTALRTDHPLR
ncbi:LCP family protein [Streptomyces sp. NPDC051976]|jgi:hypothetical protein|uniref:LCP family protein n=1 Tax=Streptomyces sp. NPDC051976 TaxID=3154947 RepID=UPI00343882B4